MSLFMKSGNSFIPSPPSSYVDKLPAATYTVGLHPMTQQFMLNLVDNMEVRHKIYGKSDEWCDRIFNTFMDRPSTTGVLLDGEKGSGKTLLTKLLSIKCRENGIPTIIINSPFTGDAFNSFIQGIEQPALILFDEFEKNYREHKTQEELLTLLDGVFPTKKLFVLTSNDEYRVNNHLINRPGRIFYFLEYKGLDMDFVVEYCNDNLNDVSHTEEIVKVASLFEKFNFDLLKALVEEVNRYGERPLLAMELLNAKPASNNSQDFTVKVAVNGVAIPEICHDNVIRVNALGAGRNNNRVGVRFAYDESENNTKYDVLNKVKQQIEDQIGTTIIGESYYLPVKGMNLVSVNGITGTYHYKHEQDGLTFEYILTKKPEVTYRWQDAF